jgi:hypothetical protein
MDPTLQVILDRLKELNRDMSTGQDKLVSWQEELRDQDPYKVVTSINNVAYRIQCHYRLKMMMVHLDRLVPYLGATQDEYP